MAKKYSHLLHESFNSRFGITADLTRHCPDDRDCRPSVLHFGVDSGKYRTAPTWHGETASRSRSSTHLISGLQTFGRPPYCSPRLIETSDVFVRRSSPAGRFESRFGKLRRAGSTLFPFWFPSVLAWNCWTPVVGTSNRDHRLDSTERSCEALRPASPPLSRNDPARSFGRSNADQD